MAQRTKVKSLLSLAMLSLIGLTAVAEPVLVCKQPYAVIDTRYTPPTDVAVDSKSRSYLLYETDGFLDIYNSQGKMVAHRGGQAESENNLSAITPVSMWVGREGRTALLVAEPHQQVIRAILVPDRTRLVTIALTGQPEPMVGNAALARDLQGRIYVWTQHPSAIYVFDSDGQFLDKQSVPTDRRPVQLAVDSTDKLYCLDTSGVKVIDPKGALLWEVAGATTMYLTGSDYLALASRDWIRRYEPSGKLEKELKSLEILRKYEPVALSINDDGQFFVYARDPFGGGGEVQKISAQGDVLTEFPQPTRTSAVPDPGTRLDYQGRIRFWERQSSRWMKIHPGGKQEASWAFVPESDPRGNLSKPSDIAIDGNDTAWICDPGNSRIQKFNLKGGWQKPFSVGIQGGQIRANPRSLALGRGLIHMVVYPAGLNGDIVLQTRNRDGKLLRQTPVCGASGEPVVKVACNGKGEIFLYQSRSKSIRGWQEVPSLTRMNSDHKVQLTVGGDERGFFPPGKPSQRVNLKPEEDLLPWGQGLLIPCNGVVYRVNPQLTIEAEYKLKLKPGRSASTRLEDFGGSCIAGNLLYLADMGNQCLQRAILP